MAVSYKSLLHLLHMMIGKDISNSDLMRQAHISTNITTKLKNGQQIALEKLNAYAPR